MKKLIPSIACVFLCLSYCEKSYAQTYIPAVRFYYNATGTRYLRWIHPICIGPGCPIETPPVIRPGIKDSTKEDIVVEDINAYPNPVSEELSIDNRTWKEGTKASVIVFDMNGKVSIKKDITQAKENIQFRSLTPGTYMVQYYVNTIPMQEWKIIKL